MIFWHSTYDSGAVCCNQVKVLRMHCCSQADIDEVRGRSQWWHHSLQMGLVPHACPLPTPILQDVDDCSHSISTWWLIPLSKWFITPVINGISRVNPLITGVITHLLSGMSHQVCISCFFCLCRVCRQFLDACCILLHCFWLWYVVLRYFVVPLF